MGVRVETLGKGTGLREHTTVGQHWDSLKVSGGGDTQRVVVLCTPRVLQLHSPGLWPFHLCYSISCAHGVISPKVLGSCRGREVAKGNSPLCLVTPSGQGGWWEQHGEQHVPPIAPDQAVRWDPAHAHVGHSSLGSTHHPAAAWCPLLQALTQ